MMVNSEWDASGPEGPIVTGILAMPFLPITDGKFLPENPLRLLQAGNLKKTEVLLGANSHEGSYFLIYFLTHLFKLQQNVSRHDTKENPAINKYILDTNDSLVK